MSINNLTIEDLKELSRLLTTLHPQTKISDKDLSKLIGKHVTFYCINYIYYGEVISFDDKKITLKNAKIVYETGPFTSSKFKDAQELFSDEWFLNRSAFESWGILNNIVI